MKKKLLLAISTVFICCSVHAQTDLYQRIRIYLEEKHPEINLDNKLIAFNVWSLKSEDSRRANKAFDKAFHVYEHARLKGGSKGIVVLAISKEELTSEVVMALKRDEVTKMISAEPGDFDSLDAGVFNAVFDSNGKEVYKNLAHEVIYSSVNNLITR